MPKAQKSPGGAQQKLSVRAVESVIDELRSVHQAITDRAFEIFEGRGQADGRAIEDWLAAERELTWAPPIELTEADGTLTLEAALAGLEASDLNVQATPDDILIKSDRMHQDREGVKVHCCEFRHGKLFREVRLPSRIDPERTQAEYRNGLLHITAPIVEEGGTQRIPVSAE